MIENPKKEKTIHARVPEHLLEQIDAKVAELDKESYGEFTRSDFLRLAITNFLSNG